LDYGQQGKSKRATRGVGDWKENGVMCEATDNLSIEELDVRSLDLAQRHEKICERIDELAFWASFVL
jgi:hypothetical protein